MTKHYEKVFDTVMALPEKERALLAGQLIDSLPQEEREEIERAWSDVIATRIRQYKAGQIEAVPARKALRQIRARIKR